MRPTIYGDVSANYGHVYILIKNTNALCLN